MRSLSRVFSLQDRAIGLSRSSYSIPQKLVKSPNSNKRMVVPGYISEVEFQNDKKVTDVNPSQITGKGANWNRYQIRFIKKRDITHPAIADYDVVPRSVREV